MFFGHVVQRFGDYCCNATGEDCLKGRVGSCMCQGLNFLD